jgi:hypothetical protein
MELNYVLHNEVRHQTNSLAEPLAISAILVTLLCVSIQAVRLTHVIWSV